MLLLAVCADIPWALGESGTALGYEAGHKRRAYLQFLPRCQAGRLSAVNECTVRDDSLDVR
jgi:hypothetical protein